MNPSVQYSLNSRKKQLFTEEMTMENTFGNVHYFWD